MAESARNANLNLTPEEKRVYYQLFQAADTTNLGVITGEIAVPFFEKTKLAPETLGLIWQIADKENRGLLTPSGFGIVMRLIGHAQAGRSPTEELAMQPGPLPRFDGLSIDNSPAPRESGTTSPPPTANVGAGAGAPIRVPPLNPEDVNKFLGLFEKSDVARSGVLSGETAKQIFERARLPNEILGRIWNLSDTKQRGALDATEFIIAMHLLTSYRLGAMRGIPQTLPPGLYDAASRRGSARSSVGSRPGLDVPPVPAIPKQFTGPQRTQSPINRQFGSPLSAQGTGGDWLVSPAEKANFDNIFATVDTAQAGVISGDQAVAFFMNAQLPEETLAQIWDLADIDADGQLTRDEFAVAMYLIRLQRSGKELPQTLAPALIPPSMRRPGSAQVAAAPAPLPQAPAPAPVQAPRSAADDLFGLDSFSAPAQPAAPSQVPQSTGGSNPPFQTPGSPSSRASPLSASTNTFKPFIPTSTFGQSIQPQATGASAGTPQPVRSPPPPADDLLGDNDPEESNKLTNETTELANLSNQIGSLATEMQNVQTKRTSAEQSLSQTSQQKRDFEARLAQARSMYEQEVKNFKALEERLNTSKAETSKLQQEYALLDGSRQDLQNQYDQVSAALAADQQENASLKEKIREANAVVAQLKPALEKARSGARQQKGLVAINKKQLATVEGEQEKIQDEIKSLSGEQPQESGESTAAVEEPPAVTSPAASTASQNTNPFFKRTATGSSDGQALSPQISNDQQRAFDSLFGPSFASPSTAGAGPPPTSFRADSQPTSTKSPVTSGVPTPSVSPPPPSGGLGRVPSPAQSRQLTPNALPLTETQSATSSTMVSPPGSRFGGQDTPSETAPTSAPQDETEETKQKFPEISEPASATQSVSSPAVSPGGEEKKDLSFDELFGGPAHKRSQSQKENDFEEAFASMKQPSGDQTNGTSAAPVSEFPPIRELDDDDDGDSTDSEAPMGFDDNFTPVAPPQSQVASAKPDTIEPSQLAAFPSPGTATSPTATSPISQQPPAANTQASPPNYEQSVKQGTGDVPEFNGLLPQRGDPTALPDAPHSVESGTGAPIVQGEPQKETTTTSFAAGEKKSNAPDFEAAFAGLNLAPAKESEDDDDDDDFETPDSKSNNGNNTDFDFSFDNPPAAQQKAPAAGSGSSDFSFDKSASATSPGGAPAQSPSDPNAKPPAHDWEALFAPLDNVNPANSAGTSPTNGASPATDPKAPGWALQTGTEDDQFLQRLTGMGFPREESLKALEQFDYNLDKAVDHLTTKT